MSEHSDGARRYGNPVGDERFMGRSSAKLAPSFLRFAHVDNGQHVLDVGCGTGVLSRAVIAIQGVGRVRGVDPLPA